MKKQTEVQLEVKERIGIAHAISVGIYLISAISVVGTIGWIVFQLVFSGPALQSVPADSTNSVNLLWTAPGDDATVGTATSYNIKYATQPIIEATWSSATTASIPPLPLPVGTTQSMTVTGLNAGATYYFALKSKDEAGNESGLSNIATKKTGLVACTPQWSCTEWSDCRDSTQTRTCIDIANPACGTDFNKPIEGQSCTTPEPKPQPASCTERWSCTEWTACIGGKQSRACSDLERCGTEENQPELSFNCSAGGTPPAEPNPTYLLTVPAAGGLPQVKVFNGVSGKVVSTFLAYGKKYRAGLSIAGGDVNRDGAPDIVTGTGPGIEPEVSVFSREGKLLLRFHPYPKRLKTGVNVAVADVNGDGYDDIITAPAKNYPALMRVFQFDPARKKFTRTKEFSAHGSKYRGGVHLAAGDLDRNGLSEIVVAPASKGRRSIIEAYEYHLTSGRFVRRQQFLAYGKTFNNGIEVAVGDVDGDGNKEILTSPAPGATDTRAWTYTPNAAVLLGKFFAASTTFRGGADLASYDVDRDGKDEIFTVSFSKGLSGIRAFTRNPATRAMKRIVTRLPAFVYGSTFFGGVRMETM